MKQWSRKYVDKLNKNLKRKNLRSSSGKITSKNGKNIIQYSSLTRIYIFRYTINSSQYTINLNLI